MLAKLRQKYLFFVDLFWQPVAILMENLLYSISSPIKLINYWLFKRIQFGGGG